MPTSARSLSRAYTMLIGAVVIIAALVIALLAISKSNHTASCLNSTLDHRSGATNDETQAQRDFSARLHEAASDGHLTAAEIESITTAYSRSLSIVATERGAIPLGKC